MELTKKILSLTKSEDKVLKTSLRNLLGFSPKYLQYYILALTHSSYNNEVAHNNERLEYLGDAFIGSIVGEYLFKKYPNQDEGFLTEMRSKIVSRQSLNDIAKRMGLNKLVRYNNNDRMLRRSQIFGNALEALVGAIYLDKGFEKTQKFILSQMIANFIDIDELESTDYNFKNKIYTWAQRHNKEIEFVTLGESIEAGRKVFAIAVKFGEDEIARATGYTKKQAHQNAAELALKKVEVMEGKSNDEMQES